MRTFHVKMSKFFQVFLVTSLLIACLAMVIAASPTRAITATAPPPPLEKLPDDKEAEIMLEKWANCSKRMGDECAQKLQNAFENSGLVNDPRCCQNLTRLGNECWNMTIRNYADPCHVLPQIMRACLEMVMKRSVNITRHPSPYRGKPHILPHNWTVINLIRLLPRY